MNTIDRRQFLFGLIGLGAAIVLPQDATPSQVDQAWNKLLADPWYFEVNESGTIVEPGDQGPETRSDVYDISSAMLKTPEDLIDEVDQYDELRGHFQSMASDELDEVRLALDDDEQLSAAQRLRLTNLETALLDEDDGWRDWILIEGKDGLPRFKEAIDTWLDEDVDWSQMEFWPRGWSAQGRALSFFQEMDTETTDALGVVIIEGEHPGSTYYAAELRNDIADANATAAKLSLPFRFKGEVTP